MYGGKNIMKTKGIFICFTGIDGSGKSTQAKNLAKNLSNNGIISKYVYARSVPIIFRPVLFMGNVLFLREKNEITDYEGHTLEKKKLLKKHGFLSKVFYKILLTDYYFQLLLKIKIPLLLGKNLVCDRYIYDTIITDIGVDAGLSEKEMSHLIQKLLLKLPNPDIIFLLDVPEENAFKRKDDVPSVEYLRDRRKFYLNVLNKYNNVKILDGTEDIGIIGKKILNIVNSSLAGYT